MHKTMDKKILLRDIEAYFHEQIQEIKRTIDQINDSMFQETKSSMGDKYETSRSMLQIDKGNALKRLDLTKRNLAALNRLNVQGSFKKVEPGALILANGKYLFYGLPLNNLRTQNLTVQGISPVSPLGKALQGKQEGSSIVFQGVEWRIEKMT
jgi:hypothetical protein